jgi:hypothetical protein
MGRHERRAAIAAFKHELHHSELLTYLIDAEQVPRDQRLRRAVAFWRSAIEQRRPFCPNCKASYANGAVAGAYLLTTPASGAASTSVTTFCDTCWLGSASQPALTIEEIERCCERVLRAVIPNGKFY